MKTSYQISHFILYVQIYAEVQHYSKINFITIIFSRQCIISMYLSSMISCLYYEALGMILLYFVFKTKLSELIFIHTHFYTNW